MTTSVRWSFREEDHAIEATIAGQGIAICSDILTRDALADGRLVIISSIACTGYGFYAVARPGLAGSEAIRRLIRWLRSL